MSAKSCAPPLLSKCSSICLGVLFRDPNVSCSILMRYLFSTASKIRSFVPEWTPSKVLYWLMSSLCSASALALVSAAAVAASVAG